MQGAVNPAGGGNTRHPRLILLTRVSQPTDTRGWDRALSTATAPGGEVARGGNNLPAQGCCRVRP
jgi:hypothetical protein